jgi:Tfp pilus assembly protein PilP
MKNRLALSFCLLLAGCTDADWDHAMNYTGLEETNAADATPVTTAPRSVAPAPTVAAAPAAEAGNTDFCRSVATQDATGNDFDPATQQRVFARSYAQCMAIYTR